MEKPLNSLPLVRGGLPLLGNIRQLKPDTIHLLLEQWAHEYGDYYRLKVMSRDVVVVANEELLLTALRNRLIPYARPENFVKAAQELGMINLFTNNVGEWELQRQLITKSMHLNTLRGAFDVYDRITATLLRQWHQIAAEDQEVDLVCDTRQYTLDILCAISLGYELDGLSQSDDSVATAMDTLFDVLNKGAQAPFSLWRYFYTKLNRDVNTSLDCLRSLINDMVEVNTRRLRSNEGQDATNILQNLIAENEKNQNKISNEQIIGNAIALIAGGYHTLGSTISWIAYHLAQNPLSQKKLHQEVEQSIEQHGEPSDFRYFDALPILNAFIKESLRIRPVAPLIFMTTTAEVVLGGVVIPAGTDIFGHSGFLSRSEYNFRHADSFMLDRWLDSSENKSGHNDRAFMPFSSGKTFCPGRNLSILQCQIFLFSVSRHFELMFGQEHPPIEERYHIGVEPSQIRLKVRARTGANPESA